MPNKKYDCIIVQTGPKDISFHFPNEKYVYSDLHDAFPDQSKCTMEIKSRRKPRSLKQNALFHAYCGIIAEETGDTPEHVKSGLKAKYAIKSMKDKSGDEIHNKETGEVLTYIQDTADMNTEEMTKLIDNTRVFAAEWFKIELPLPEEQIDLKLKK